MRKRRLGDALLRQGRISAEVIENMVREQAGGSGLLGEMLLKRGLISKSDLISALEEIHGVPYLEASAADVQAEALRLIPYALAQSLKALPIQWKKSKLIVLMEQPGNLQALQELSFASGMPIEARLGLGQEILEAIRKYYEVDDLGSPSRAGSDIEFVTATSSQQNLQAIREFQASLRQEPTPAVEAVTSILTAAITKKASDIHIDPQPQGAAVRIRVDGILRELRQIPIRLQEAVASRIKILADMDIAERRAPQDGRIHIRIGQEKRDLRVSTLPTQYGEKIVIRLLDVRSALTGFQDLGLWQEHVDLLSEILKAPQGMILVTGPTGSGKTTTLYAALNFLRSRTLNIITVEDPVEYRLDGVNQVQVHEKAGRTFATSLRSILRQDPNVIMVGEIRDSETAEIALRAAQTGHLVLSTMHTRDSASAVARLLDLGVPPFLIASSITAVIAQRLVRKLCECRIAAAASPTYAALMAAAGIKSQNRMYIPGGCSICDSCGYVGRVGIYEMLVMDDDLTELVRSGAGLREIARAAIDNGMRTIEQDALLKISMGITSLEEVMRVVTFKNQGGQKVQKKFRDLATQA